MPVPLAVGRFFSTVSGSSPLSKRAVRVLVSSVSSLRGSASARRAAGEIAIFGQTMIREHIQRRGQIKQLFRTRECGAIDTSRAGLPSASHVLVDTGDIARMSGVESPPNDGCAAIVPMPDMTRPEQLTPRTLVLDRVSDPGNMGTLLRSSMAFDFGTVIVIGGCDPLNEKVIRASMGAVLQLRLWSANEADFLAACRSSGHHLLVCDASHRETIPHQQCQLINQTTKACLVIGNEAHGVRPEFIAAADARIHIPMHPAVESLNAAVAGSIIMQHIRQQQISRG